MIKIYCMSKNLNEKLKKAFKDLIRWSDKRKTANDSLHDKGLNRDVVGLTKALFVETIHNGNLADYVNSMTSILRNSGVLSEVCATPGYVCLD